jgi:hypothetical protein
MITDNGQPFGFSVRRNGYPVVDGKRYDWNTFDTLYQHIRTGVGDSKRSNGQPDGPHEGSQTFTNP